MHLATTILTRLRLAVVALAVLFVGAAPGVARAQNDLASAVVQSTSLSDGQKQEIAAYASEGLTLFKNTEWIQSRNGRNQLLRPLEDPLVSVAFRLEYSRLLCASLAASAEAGQPDITRLNAIRVLGAIATAQTAEPIARQLADPAPSIRFMATQAAGASFRALATSSPALPAGDAARLVTTLAKLAESEQDVMVMDGAVIALIEATRVELPEYKDLRESAYALLARSVGARLRALPADSTDEAMIAAVLRAGIAARDGLSIARTKASDATSKELAGFGGDLIAYVLKRAKAGQLPAAGSGALRAALEQLVSVGEADIFFALLNLNAQRDPTTLADTLKAGTADSERLFTEQAASLIQSTLTAPPLTFPADRFLK